MVNFLTLLSLRGVDFKVILTHLMGLVRMSRGPSGRENVNYFGHFCHLHMSSIDRVELEIFELL